MYRYLQYSNIPMEETMKPRVLSILCLIFFMASAGFANTGVIWRTGFESGEGYSLGNLFGQDSWAEFPLTDVSSLAYITNSVYNGTVIEGTQCALLPKGTGVNPRSTANRVVDISTVDISKDFVRVSCRIWADANYSEFRLYGYDGEYTNVICRMLRFNDNMWFIADADSDGLNLYPIDGAKGGPVTAAWYDWSILLDLQRKRIIEVVCSNRVFDCTKTNDINSTTGNVGFLRNDGRIASTISAVYFQNGGDGGDTGRKEVYVDDVQITTEPMPPGAAEMEVNPSFIDFSRRQSNGVLNVVNAGTGEFFYTATILEPQTWLSIDHNSATVSVQDVINVSINRTGLPDGYYHSSIFFDAGDMGATTVQIMVAVGNVLYYSDFEHERVGKLFGQDLWNGNPGNSADVTNGFNDGDGNFVFIHDAGNTDGCNRFAPYIPANIIVRIGAKCYIPEAGGADSMNIDTSDYWHKQLDFTITRNGSECNITSGTFPVSLPSVPVDEWFDLEITMDFESTMLLSVKFGENVQAFTNEYLLNPVEHVIQGAGIFSSSSSGSSGICFDDFFIREIPRGGPPVLSAPKAREIPFTSSSVQLTLVNTGTGSVSYTATVLDGTTWLTISPTNGTFFDTKSITCTADRGSLDPGYHRCRIAFDGGAAGSVISVVMVSVDGVFFASDFSEPWYHEGKIAGQDLWENANQLLFGADVTNLPGSESQCLLIHSSELHEGIYRPVSMEQGELVKLSARFYMPGQGGADTIMFLTRDFGHEKVYNVITRDDELGLVELTLPNYPEFSVPAVMTDTWFTFSYTMDLTLQELVQIQFGDTVTNMTDTMLENATVQFFNSIAIFCPTNTPESAGVLVDDVKLEVVPEPGTIMLLLALIAAGVVLQGKR